MEQLVIDFEIERETPNTIRYKEISKNGQPPKVKTIYIQKWVFGDNPPEKLRVTIEAL